MHRVPTQHAQGTHPACTGNLPSMHKAPDAPTPPNRQGTMTTCTCDYKHCRQKWKALVNRQECPVHGSEDTVLLNHQLICGVLTVSVESTSFGENYLLIQALWKCKGLRIAKETLKRRLDKELTLPGAETETSTVIEAAWYWHKDRRIYQFEQKKGVQK